MSYADWPVESTAFFGPPGALVPIPIPKGSTIDETPDTGWVFRRSLSGQVRAQRLPFARRSWRVGLSQLTDSELDGLQGVRLLAASDARSYWITPDMQGNLVSPQAGRWEGWASGHGGSVRLDDGTILPASFLATNPFPRYCTDLVCAPPNGGTVNGSAYLVGSAARLRIDWHDAQGAVIAQELSGAIDSSGSPRRVSLDADAPGGAVSLRLWAEGNLTAGQQITWGSGVKPYRVPSGCSRALIVDPTRSLSGIYGADIWRTAGFTVQEIG